jgi:hypothetical protein
MCSNVRFALLCLSSPGIHFDGQQENPSIIPRDTMKAVALVKLIRSNDSGGESATWYMSAQFSISRGLKEALYTVYRASFEAGDGIRTRDIYLGKVALYH